MLRSTRVSHFFPFTRRSDAVRLVSQSTSRDSASEDEIKEARAWLTRFNAETIPKELYEFSFSRSSGPGGQNVNKYAMLDASIIVYSNHIKSEFQGHSKSAILAAPVIAAEAAMADYQSFTLH